MIDFQSSEDAEQDAASDGLSLCCFVFIDFDFAPADGLFVRQKNIHMNKHAISRTGWWIAGLLEKHSFTDRAPYWNNYRLIKAEDWRTAFLKATAMGETNARAGNDAFSGHQEFIGVSDLLPIYDELEDGAEVLWQELEAIEDGDGVPLRVFSESYFEDMYKDQEGEQGMAGQPA